MQETKTNNNSVPTVSKIYQNKNKIIDMVLVDGKTKLCLFENGSWQVAEKIVFSSEEVLVPLSENNNLIKHQAILFPESPLDYGDNISLAEDIKEYINKYVYLSNEALDTAICYVLLTWVFEAFEDVPYLRFLGDLGSGKTRALKIIGSIVNKGFFASAASTISPIFYTLDLFSPTLILDEADMRYTDAANEIVKVYNNGTSKGLPVLRQTISSKKGDFEPRAFQVFGPKIVAMRKRFQDDGLESRFLTEEMRRTPKGSAIPISLSKSQAEEALKLRNKLLMYRFNNLNKIKIEEDKQDKHHSPRFNQMLLPLLAVAPNTNFHASLLSFAKKCDLDLQEMRKTTLEEVVKNIYENNAQKANGKGISLEAIAEEARLRLSNYGRPITNKLVGSILRNNLGLTTWKSNGVYLCSPRQASQLSKSLNS